MGESFDWFVCSEQKDVADAPGHNSSHVACVCQGFGRSYGVNVKPTFRRPCRRLSQKDRGFLVIVIKNRPFMPLIFDELDVGMDTAEVEASWVVSLDFFNASPEEMSVGVIRFFVTFFVDEGPIFEFSKFVCEPGKELFMIEMSLVGQMCRGFAKSQGCHGQIYVILVEWNRGPNRNFLGTFFKKYVFTDSS